jgi:AmmeMemoRadiSam system protein A
MAPSPSGEPDRTLSPDDAGLLLDLAERTIVGALRGATPTLPDTTLLPPAVMQQRGAFVTLEVDGRLNGCIGHIEAREPLAESVARLALAAAFDDPRLPALRGADLPGLTISLSLLGPMSPVRASGLDELLAALEPGRDGLLVEHTSGRAVFLPQVWEQLPRPTDFVDALWHKAGFAAGTWPDGLRSFTFLVEHHGRALAAGGTGDRP